MSIMKLLEQAQGGQGLAQLANQFGLDEAKVQSLTQMLAPALGSAAKKRVANGDGAQVLEAFRGQEQAEMFEDAEIAASERGQAQGADFLQSLLGGQDQAEGLAREAAERSGVDAGTVMQFLPAIAAMMQGGLQKQMPDSAIDGVSSSLMGSAEGAGVGLMGMVGGMMGGAKQGGAGGLNPLMQMLDADGDGSVMDDVLDRFIK